MTCDLNEQLTTARVNAFEFQLCAGRYQEFKACNETEELALKAVYEMVSTNRQTKVNPYWACADDVEKEYVPYNDQSQVVPLAIEFSWN